jgi:RNA polymerase sigma-70 factor, ECF subfamily
MRPVARTCIPLLVHLSACIVRRPGVIQKSIAFAVTTARQRTISKRKAAHHLRAGVLHGRDGLKGMTDRTPAQAEFAEYLRRHQSQLFGYIHSLVRDLNDADDVFQQTTVVLWNKFSEFDRQRSFIAWACGVARLEVSTFLRSRSRRRLYFTDELNLLLIQAQAQLTPSELEDRRAALVRCVQKLRERDRQLLDDCYGDTGVNATAERQGRSTQSVHNSLRRIRRALFECIRRTLVQEAYSELMK